MNKLNFFIVQFVTDLDAAVRVWSMSSPRPVSTASDVVTETAFNIVYEARS